MEQQEIIQMAKNGDKEALVNLLKSVELPIYKTAFYFMGNEHDAKDATQEALIKIYTKLHTFQEKAKFNTWVQRIITNICMDKFRKNKNEISIEGFELIISNSADIEKKIEEKILIEELFKNINLLPNNYRMVIIMRYIHQLSYQEIADTLDIPINTVKSYLFRGRDKLLNLMGNRQIGGVQQ